jgi:hypothetical protein
MTKKLLFVTTILLVVAFAAFAADVTGKWTYEQQGRNGNASTVTLNLTASGSALTGTVLGGMGGRRGGGGGGGGTPQPVNISKGTVNGSKITFEISREGQNGTMTTKYAGELSGDSLKLTIERPGRDGNTTKVEATAKRATT